MLELPHTVVGGLIASKIPNPLISLPLALLSHFLTDLIPHWDPSLYSDFQKTGHASRKTTIWIIVDAVLSLGFGFFIASRALPDWKQAIIIVLGCFFAVAPDVIEGFYYFLGWRAKFLKNLIEFQHRLQVNVPFLPGVFTQVIVILLSLCMILSSYQL